MKTMIVVGARPNFMKAFPIIEAIRKYNQKNKAEEQGPQMGEIQHLLVHTGQHYDSLMSDAFFSDLGLPVPDIRLAVGSGSHADQTAEVLAKFEKVLLRERPDVVIVVGDVNSTVACALATAKIAFGSAGERPLLVHVEAGLRSFDRSMPEEVNRVVTDHLSDLLFTTEQSGIDNLLREGLPTDAIHFVGNTMIDSLLAFKDRAETSNVLGTLGLECRNGHGATGVTPYGLLTLHRPANVDNSDNLINIIRGLDGLSTQQPIIFPIHPRTRNQVQKFGLESYFNRSGICKDRPTERIEDARRGIIPIDPLGYLDFLCLMKHASLVITDSGGIQEETTCLGIPCVTVRDNTERPVTIQKGTNILAGTSTEGIRVAIKQQMGKVRVNCIPEKWDGRAGTRILEVLISSHSKRIDSRELSAVR